MCGVTSMVMMVVTLVVMVSVVSEASPRFGDCAHNTHCEEQACCKIGFNRYSVPQCSPRGQQGDYCSLRSADPRPFSLHYPNGFQVEIEEGHHGMCPCQPGLECSTHTSTCEPISTAAPQQPPTPMVPQQPPTPVAPAQPQFVPSVPSRQPVIPSRHPFAPAFHHFSPDPPIVYQPLPTIDFSEEDDSSFNSIE